MYKNKGACLKFDDELLNIRQFVSSPHPYYLPNFMDVFTWSLPFVAEKVTDMLYSILAYEGTEGDTDGTVSIANQQSDVLAKKGGVLKDKVVAVTKLMRMYKVLKLRIIFFVFFILCYLVMFTILTNTQRKPK